MNESANVALVRGMYNAFLRGDLPAILASMDEAIISEFPGSSAVPMSGTRRGVGEMQAFFNELAVTIEFSVFEPTEYIAQGNRVVALVHYEGKMIKTGRKFNLDSVMVWTVENGKATRFREYTDTETLAEVAQPAGAASAA